MFHCLMLRLTLFIVSGVANNSDNIRGALFLNKEAHIKCFTNHITLATAKACFLPSLIMIAIIMMFRKGFKPCHCILCVSNIHVIITITICFGDACIGLRMFVFVLIKISDLICFVQQSQLY